MFRWPFTKYSEFVIAFSYSFFQWNAVEEYRYDFKKMFFLVTYLANAYVYVVSELIKQSCFIRKWGRGEGDFWYGWAIYRDYIFI
jgi:hypothetical protein